MSAMTDNAPAITSGDLKSYRKPVRDVLMEAINDCGVGYRLLDGNHIRLYNGDRDVVPLKVSASRPDQDTLRYLVPWLNDNCESWAKRHEQVEETDLALLKTALDTSEHVEETVETQEREEGWEPWKFGFETNGKEYRCEVCGWSRENARGLHLHQSQAHPTAEQAAANAEYHRNAVQARVLTVQQKKTHLTQAVAVLAEHYGVADTKSTARLQAKLDKALDKVAQQAEEIERLKIELENEKARFALIKEALKQ